MWPQGIVHASFVVETYETAFGNTYDNLLVETISWKIFNQPIIIQTICNLSHDNGNGINHSLTATTTYQSATTTPTTTQ